MQGQHAALENTNDITPRSRKAQAGIKMQAGDHISYKFNFD